MRSTGPSLRRRNYVKRKNERRWLSQRDDDSDGFASGEDSGPDSDSDDEDAFPIARPLTRPTGNAGQSVGAVGGSSGTTLGVGSGSVVAGGANKVVQPIIPPTEKAVVLPGSTLGAAEGGVEEESVSDSVSDGIDSLSDSASEDEATTTAPPPPPPPATTAPAAIATPPPPPALTTSSSAAPPPPPPPASTSTAATTRPPPPALAPANPGTTSTSSSSTVVVALPAVTESTTSIPGGGVQTLPLPSQTATRTQATPSASGTGALISSSSSTIAPTPLPTLEVPTTDVAPVATTALGGSVQEDNAEAGNTLGAATGEEPRMNAGAAAGIVVGVLALIGLLVGAAFLYKKWRRNNDSSPLPFFGRKSNRDSAPGMAYNGATMEKDTIPILPPPSLGEKKTNSEMMDHLMQATFRAENGGRDSGPNAQPVPFQPGFLDETAYTALAGPPTPMMAPPPGGKPKPVIQWLDNVKTPRQSGVTRWPSADAPPIPPTKPGPMPPWQADPPSRPPMPQFKPPQPAFRNEANARYTATTNTTTTTGSDVWYG
ncbi:hypothetical protein QBC47DRAFT_148715 [Echria macrotheca]|uniref:Uncharacterized protein n=1 Tax=Echria macrotheca TaxID=438768 RepID=A0AAJ0BI27_9PEZI|nr:hypothetical protein QBC47DRAFT_148715 [Echria macrotheca]